MKLPVYLFFLFIAAVLFSCKTNVDPSLIYARQGKMDLSSWDLHISGKIALDGEWEFYNNQLLSPVDFTKHIPPRPDGFAMVPGNWNTATSNTQKSKGQGYATYRLLLTGFHSDSLLALRIWAVNTAYRLWVNDEFLAANGRVSTKPDSTIPQILPLVKVFRPAIGDSLQIIIQVANFIHAKGGIRTSIDFGNPDIILRERDSARVAELWLAGAMFILFIYHLFIFLLRRKEQSSLWFSLLCLDSTVRNLVTSECIFNTTFPQFPYFIIIRAEYLTVTMGVPIYVMLAYSFFKQELSLKIRNIILFICGLEFFLICFFPVKVFTGLLNYIQLIVLLECVYLIYIVVRAMANRREFAILSFISYCLCFAGIIHDVLVSQLVINSPFIIFYAFSAFLLMQAYILAYRNSTAYKRIEYLSEELNEANITLEKKVVDRTRELNRSNDQLIKEKRKSDDLLLNILPAEIAEELKESGSSKARRYPSVTVMFTDFKDFTRLSEELTPEQLVREIDYCYSHFDALIEKHGLEKIKTMGDAYICAGGLPTMNFTHPEDVVLAAMDIRDFMETYKNDKKARDEPYFEIRIGVHTGPVVAGIVGSKKFAYDIWGDTVNVAARMESSGEVSRVNISAPTYQMIKDKFKCMHRGKIDAKNIGAIDMYFVERK